MLAVKKMRLFLWCVFLWVECVTSVNWTKVQTISHGMGTSCGLRWWNSCVCCWPIHHPRSPWTFPLSFLHHLTFFRHLFSTDLIGGIRITCTQNWTLAFAMHAIWKSKLVLFVCRSRHLDCISRYCFIRRSHEPKKAGDCWYSQWRRQNEAKHWMLQLWTRKDKMGSCSWLKYKN